MSILIVPIVAALFAGPQDLGPVPAQPPAAAVVQSGPAAELMEQTWRRYRRIGSAAITATGARTWADGRVDPIRSRSMIAPTGEVKVIGSDHNLTFKKGTAYADSPFYTGMQIQVPALPRPDAAVNALAEAWPVEAVPLAIRLRLGGSPESAFATLLEYAGDSPSIDVQAGVWSDGLACEILRVKSADGATDLALWIDQLTGFARGLRGSIRPMNGRPASTIEVLYETIETERPPLIAVANRGVTGFDSYEAMVAAWNEKYAVPPTPEG